MMPGQVGGRGRGWVGEQGKGKADTLSTGRATVISGSASVTVTVHTGQPGKRKANSCSSSRPERCGFLHNAGGGGEVSCIPTEERREGE